VVSTTTEALFLGEAGLVALFSPFFNTGIDLAAIKAAGAGLDVDKMEG
jgi:hypothetical protein